MKLKQYPKYKDSGIQWIGKIPEEWEIRKVKHFSISIAGGTPDTTNMDYWDGNIPWLPSGMVHDKSIFEKEVKTFITLEGVSKSSTKWIKKDSVLVALTGATCANIAYLTFRATANQSVIGIQPSKNSEAKYIFYYLLSQREQILIHQTGGAQAGINKEEVINLFCSFPKKQEQTQIANFLDRKTQNISQTIEKDKKLIELLKEKKIALINHVVTKGLDKNAKMKESGIDWIGKIPEGWEVRRLANLGYFSKGRGIPRENLTKEGVSAILYGDIYTKYELKVKNVVHKINEENSKSSILLKKGDLLLTGSGETREDIGKTVVYLGDTKTYAGGDIIIYKLNNINSEFMSYVLNSLYTITQKILFSKGDIIVHIYASKLREIIVALPPKPQQLQIVKYLDKQTTKIDRTINKIQEKITLMEEYKKSLIHHVVTGKVDVRGVEV